MDRKNIEKITDDPEDRILLAKLWDKIQAGMTKNIFAHTGFLSAHQLQLAQYLFGACQGLTDFGGYPDAQRRILAYLPEYLDEQYLTTDDSPVVCLRAGFYQGDRLTHRDFLGALMGMGITRESIGDILVRQGACDFFVTEKIAPFILQNLESAGRTKLTVTQIPLTQAVIPEESFEQLRDTVASVRLDSILASGFSISRAVANGHIQAGKAMIDGVVCTKPDRIPAEGCAISLRGFGKLKLTQIGHTTKKGRISVVIHRYK